MPNHDAQTVILSRTTILLVTGVSVGLLTLTYVLGVQVGKQSAALRQSRSRTAGEDLTELPASIDEQLKLLDNREFEKTHRLEAPEPKAAETPAPETKPGEAQPPDAKVPDAKGQDAKAQAPKPGAEPPKTEAKKPEPKKEAPKAETKGAEKWTLQLVSTPDEAEAKRVAAKSKTAGFTPTIVKEKRLFKVRLVKTGTRAEMDAAASKLKARGQNSFAVKVP